MSAEEIQNEEELGKPMSFMEHLDEFRKRLIRSVIFVTLAFLLCFYVSDRIYRFLAIPINQAIAKQKRDEIPVKGMNDDLTIKPLSDLKEGDNGRFAFDKPTKLGVSTVPQGASVLTIVSKDKEGNLKLYTDEPIFTKNAIIPKGVELPFDFKALKVESTGDEGKMVITTATEAFTVYVTVSLYAAIALSIPFLLLQIWGFISPALYAHERSYVTPFISLSSISFVAGAAFAYYVLFPPAVAFLLFIGSDFTPMLHASEYLDFIILIMLAMGIIFQMPAVTYVLARIGLVSASLLIRSWKIAIVVILIVAAVASPTSDIPNMLFFATPMIILYLISIFVAWLCGRQRKTTA
jgi:sec-independent protein translocase protein TatC